MCFALTLICSRLLMRKPLSLIRLAQMLTHWKHSYSKLSVKVVSKIAHDKTSSEVGKGVDSLENVYSKLCQSCLEHCS